MCANTYKADLGDSIGPVSDHRNKSDYHNKLSHKNCFGFPYYSYIYASIMSKKEHTELNLKMLYCWGFRT